MTDSLTPPEPDSPAPIAPVVESATPTQQRAAIAVAAATTSAAAASTSAAAATTAVAAGQVPERVQLADKVGEALAVLVFGALAWHHIVPGEFACWLIFLVVTGGVGLRAILPRLGLPAVGGPGLAFIAAGAVLTEFLSRGSSGRARGEQIVLGLMLAPLLFLLACAVIALRALTH